MELVLKKGEMKMTVMTDSKMAIKNIRYSILKMYALICPVVAFSILFYLLMYVEMVKAGPFVFIGLAFVVMTITVVTAMLLQQIQMRDAFLLFSGATLDNDRLYRLKKRVLNYPYNLIAHSTFCWVFLSNALLYLQIYMIFSGSIQELIIVNLLTFPGTLNSAIITFFFCEKASSIILEHPSIKKIEIQKKVFIPSIQFKIMIVCFFIIFSISF